MSIPPTTTAVKWKDTKQTDVKQQFTLSYILLIKIFFWSFSGSVKQTPSSLSLFNVPSFPLLQWDMILRYWHDPLSHFSMAQWSELGIWIQKTRVQIPDSDYWMDLSSVILGANSPRFVNNQLVCLLPVGILNWERGEGDFNLILKSHFIGELSLNIFFIFYLFYILFSAAF